MDKTNVQANFTIIANVLDHIEVSSVLGIEPSYIRHSNEVLNNGRLFGHDEWGIGTEYEESLDINDQLKKITDAVYDKTAIVNEVCEKFHAKCHFLIVVNVENGEFPAMYFESDFIKFATSINAEIGFDPYFLSNCE